MLHCGEIPQNGEFRKQQTAVCGKTLFLDGPIACQFMHCPQKEGMIEIFTGNKRGILGEEGMFETRPPLYWNLTSRGSTEPNIGKDR